MHDLCSWHGERRRVMVVESMEARCLLALTPGPTESSFLLACRCEAAADSDNSSWLLQFENGEAAALPDSAYEVAAEEIAFGWFRLSLPCALTDVAASHYFSDLPGLVSYQRDIAVHTANLHVNDPLAPSLHGLAKIDVERSWTAGITGQGTVIAVLDTGVDYLHQDLASSIWTNIAEIPGNGFDDDGNGYVDDVSGYDFFENDADPMDVHGHGTHVAGTIAAARDNGIGVVGVSPDAKVLPVRFLGPGGNGSLSDAVRAINYVTRLKQDGAVNIVAINASWGSSTAFPPLEQAIRAAGEAGILVVAAAGNAGSNNDLQAFFPANVESENVIAVAATDQLDQLAAFSNYGVSQVDIAAPGVNIVSTYSGNRYQSLSGTSMAAPHVSGLLALLAQRYRQESSAQLRDRLFASSDTLLSLDGNVRFGSRINAGRAVGNGSPPTPPDAPAPTPPPYRVWLDDYTLFIEMNDRDDIVQIGQRGRDAYTVTLNGQLLEFRWSQVFRLHIMLSGGNDMFVNESDLPSRVHGGDGDDSLTGGLAADRLFGELGDDLLLGREGLDILRGGGGNDELRGGRGADEVFGGRGQDTLVGGRGEDLLDGGEGTDRIVADAKDWLENSRGDRLTSRS